MTTLTTYLLLDGTCQQAMQFYNTVFGGTLSYTSVGDSPIRTFELPSSMEAVLNPQQQLYSDRFFSCPVVCSYI